MQIKIMNDDPYGTMTPASSILPLPAAVALLMLFFVLGALFAMCESAVNTASESRVKKDAENGSRRAKKFLAYLDANESFASPLQLGMMLMGFFLHRYFRHRACTGFRPCSAGRRLAAHFRRTARARPQHRAVRRTVSDCRGFCPEEICRA